MMVSMRYIWSKPYGRLAVAAVIVGIVGLALHYWAPVLLAIALPRDAR